MDEKYNSHLSKCKDVFLHIKKKSIPSKLFLRLIFNGRVPLPIQIKHLRSILDNIIDLFLENAM